MARWRASGRAPRASAVSGRPRNGGGCGLAAPYQQPTGVRPGCLIGGGLFVAGVLAAIAVLALLPLLDDGGIDLGRLDEYPPGSVVYRATDGFFVVRLASGDLLALSDIDPHNPRGRRSCRVTFRPDLAPPGAVEAGAAAGVFFDACTESRYDISGRGFSGDGLDLRRIEIERSGDSLSVSSGSIEG